jgi:antitoxin YefM
MQVVNFTEARNRLKAIFDTVCHEFEDVVVHRKNNENVVIISLEKYNSLMETDYLLRTPANREHLLKSLRELEAGETVEKSLEELDAEA